MTLDTILSAEDRYNLSALMLIRRAYTIRLYRKARLAGMEYHDYWRRQNRLARHLHRVLRSEYR